MNNPKAFALGLAVVLIALAVAACSSYDNSTPTKAYQTSYTARKNKDVKAYKSVTSKRMMQGFEAAAKELNKSVDGVIETYLQHGTSAPPQMPEIRNEVIAPDGKTATLEIGVGGLWTTVNFTKEDDGWKVGG
jgi:uncharacterized lipoprotein